MKYITLLLILLAFSSCSKSTYSGVVKGKYIDPFLGHTVYFYDPEIKRNITVFVSPNRYNNIEEGKTVMKERLRKRQIK